MAEMAAARSWSVLAAAVAGGGVAAGRVRVSRDGGRSYPRSGERALSTRLPGQPAAVLVYGPDGTARCLSLDFDVSRGGLVQVAADVQQLGGLLGACGAGWFADRSPSGGRHVYVPLAVPVGFVQVRQVALALRLLLPSLDVSPLVNLTSGCIRPPGARHRTGGWQSLDGPLTDAARLINAPNPPQVWAALLEHLAPQLHTLALDDTTTGSSAADQQASLQVAPGAAGAAGPKERAAQAAGTVGTGSPVVGTAGATAVAGAGAAAVAAVPAVSGLSGRRRSLRAAVLQVARTGVFDPVRYRSPSEARQAVLASAAASGWSWADVTGELEAGRWPGLWGFYARYAPRHRREALAGDWLAALDYARQLPPPTRPAPVPAADRAGQPGSAARRSTSSPGTGAQAAHPLPPDRPTDSGAADLSSAYVHSSDTREPPTHRGRPAHTQDPTGSRNCADELSIRPRDRYTAAAARGRGGVRALAGVDGEFGFVRSWWSAVLVGERDRYRGRRGQTTRLVLRALGAAAQKTGRRHVAFGVRSLSLACGVSPSTVATVLGRLRQEADPFVLLVEAGRGLQGDLYELRIPDAYQAQAQAQPWRPGKITALLPVFRHLGVPAAFVYEALDNMAHSSWDLAAVALLSPRAAQQALAELAAHGLAVRDRDGWRRGPADPTAVARALGVLNRVDELLERYRAHRHAWRQRLLAGGLLTVAAVLAATRPTRSPRPDADEPEAGAEAGQRWLTRRPQPPPSPAHASQAARAARAARADAAAGATATASAGAPVPGPVPGSVLGESPDGVPGDVLELLRLELGAVVLA